MIEVKMMLHDSGELTHFHAFVQKMEDRRRAWADRYEQRVAAAYPNGEPAYPAGAPTDIDEVPPVAFVQAPDAPRATVSMAELEESIKAYSNRNGLEKARALLDRFVVAGGRLGQVPEERWAELHAELTK